ncbi:MAG: 16S rRNA (uracil(1498)-N(3))-methyltransferase [Planctomycetes bacterium]|nr:16S rRNA (uracil(1498)-N(3))-methyltransferase [Planctomycetota bacterium]
MNLLLLDATELDANGRTTLTGRRARHLLEVLQVAPGRALRVGLVDGPLGTAQVLRCAPPTVELACEFDADAPRAHTADTLLLAVPRPKVLLRALEDAAALGFGRIVLMRTWRVDRSHLESRAATDPDLAARHLRLGLEQSCRTRLPVIEREPRFRPFVEDRLDASLAGVERFVAHPSPAAIELAALTPAPHGPLALAIGPERGFTDQEIEMLGARGFRAVRSGPHPLRVEPALVAVAVQLQLLRARATRGG